MPPSKRKAKETEAAMAFFADLLGKDKAEVEQAVADVHPQQVEISVLQAEGVLLHLYNIPRTMLSKYCKECEETFSTRYQAVAYCSNSCRRKAMERVGIRWDPRTDHYANMEAERPIVVSPEVHAVIVAAAQRILEDQNIQVESSPTKEEYQEPEYPVLILPPEELGEDHQYSDVSHTSPEPLLPELDGPELPDLMNLSPF